MNRGSDSILSVYSDARTEYTKQLSIYLVPAYFQFFIELLDKAKQSTTNEPKKMLWQFQTYLNEIHDWNMEKVNNEINRILNNSGCDYMEDLLTAVFIAHTKVLTAIRLSSNNKKVQITVPKVEHFLFKVLCESSKLLWSNTFLFRDGISSIEKQQNYRNIEQLLNEGILMAVRSLVPVKSILKDFVNMDGAAANDDNTNTNGDDESDDEDEEKSEEKSEEIPKSLDEESKLETPENNQTISENTETIPNTLIAEPEKIPELVPIEQAPAQQLVQQPLLQPVQQEQQQMIYVDEKPEVQFGDFDAVFDTEDPDGSEMISAKDEDDDTPALEILEESGVPLSDELDFDSLDDNAGQEISANDYDTIV
jgi:hypothetical protein